MARHIIAFLSSSLPVILSEVKNLLFLRRIEYTYVSNITLRINSAKNLSFQSQIYFVRLTRLSWRDSSRMTS